MCATTHTNERTNSEKLNMNTKIKIGAMAATLLLGAISAHAQLFITQYYEGPSTNKWIELTNTGSSTIDLTGFALGHWNNANAEGYKTSVAPSFTMTLSGSLTAGSTILIGNTGNTEVTYATATITNNTVINFNGNDSIVLYSAGTFSTASIIDAIGFTTSGNEGADKSFVRTSLLDGWNTTAGSNATNFSGVWLNVSNATVKAASVGTEERLGFSSLSSVPEPSSFALIAGGLTLGAVLMQRRRKAVVA
jgi:predicted extracellular nuclease